MNSAALRLMERAMAATPSAATPTRQYSLPGAQHCKRSEACVCGGNTSMRDMEVVQGHARACLCVCAHMLLNGSRMQAVVKGGCARAERTS